jgi:hypothetical protein
VQTVATELHQVQHNGRTVELNTIEVLLLSMRNLAMSGHLQAAKWLSDYRAQVLPDAGAQGGYLVVPEIMPTEQCIEREIFLNKFRTNPELREDPLIASTYTRDKK